MGTPSQSTPQTLQGLIQRAWTHQKWGKSTFTPWSFLESSYADRMRLTGGRRTIRKCGATS